MLGQKKIFIAALVVFLGLFFLSLDFYSSGGMLQSHVKLTTLWLEGKHSAPHPGVPLLVYLVSNVLPLSIERALHYVCSLHVSLAFICTYLLLHCFIKKPFNGYLICFAALLLLFISPIAIYGLDERIINFKQNNRGILLWRNTTHTVAQPYIILCFLFYMQWIAQGTAKARTYGLLCSALLFFTALIKPSFAVSFIPAVVVAAVVMRTPRIKEVCLVLLPSLLLVAYQSIIIFISSASGDVRGLYFDPMSVWTHNNKMPLLYFLLSVAFPLYLALCRGKELGPIYWVAVLNMMIAYIPYVLLKESGDRDFEWGTVYGIQLLFIASTVELIRWWQLNGNDRRVRIGMALLILHTVSGVGKLVILWP